MAAKTKTEDSGKLSIEEAFGQIEEKIGMLQKDDISLEDSFKLYKEGMDLLKNCNASIDKVEKQVMQIRDHDDGD